MALFGSANPEHVPANVLFPEHYKASCRMIARDFALFGTGIVVTVVGLAYFF